MAGTMIFRLQVDHIYQRRFRQEELAWALKSSHWYIVTRRPRVRAIEGSAAIDDRILTVDVLTRPDPNSSTTARTLGIDFGQFETISNFKSHVNGAYFTVELDGELAHGDAWALASLLSDADKELAAQEVIYIGEAFGTDGSSNAWIRTSKHKKLQEIYEEHNDSDFDIFVAPLSLERRAWTSDDHIDDDDDGPDLQLYYEHFAVKGEGIRKPAVDLIEHSLISYFAPPYNEKLTEWRADRPTTDMQLMRDAGFRLIQVHLSGWAGLARFYSATAPDRFRSHLISHDIPPAPHQPVKRGISAQRLSDWRSGSLMVQEGQEIVERVAERTGVTIRVFGESAPTLRTPAGVLLPKIPQVSADTAAMREALRAKITEQREAARRASAPLLHDGKSTYDPTTGTIRTGEWMDGTPVRTPLHDPSTGKVHTAISFGDPGSGRSNGLLLRLHEARATGLFVPAVADVTAEGAWRARFKSRGWGKLVAEGLVSSIKLLESCCRVIDDRSASNAYKGLSREAPALLLGIDDADALVHNKYGAHLVSRILSEGGKAGVGLALVLGDITDFEDDPAFMRSLVAADSVQAYTQQGAALLKYLDARYKSERSRSWSDDGSPLFVLHQDRSSAVLGMVAAQPPDGSDEATAKAWFVRHLHEFGVQLIMGWQRHDDDPNSWWDMDLNATRWFLRRHRDGWLAVAAISQVPRLEKAELFAWAEGQLEARFEARRSRWQIGPGTDAPDTAVFYSSARGQVTPKDLSGVMKEIISSIY